MMNKEVYSVFFKVESETVSPQDMIAFGKECVEKINKSAKYKIIKREQNAISYVVSFTHENDAERFIHEYNYAHHNNETKTLAMWNNKRPRFEVYVSEAPHEMTRRELFLAMERFGPIGKVTISNRNRESGWVTFLYKNSFNNALASPVYIDGKQLKVSMTAEADVDSFPSEQEVKKNISFKEISKKDVGRAFKPPRISLDREM
jgi:hypothetical protein